MRTRQEAVEFGLTFKDTYVETPFRDANWQLVRVKKSKKAFLWIYERDGFINLNIKVNPEWRDFWRETYKSVIPGYHQNKEHWNTIILDGTVPEKEIKRMISESYDIITDSPTKRIYEAVKKIPKGHVATYGRIAEMAGEPKMARAVGNALHKNPDPDNIPCFRVVNSKGELAGEFADQWGLTREELDEFSANSQQKCEKAMAEGKFKDEIVPVEVKTRKQTIIVDTDEGPRAGTTVETLSKLRCCSGKPDGVVTAGNASGINDGAAAVVVMSEEKAKELGVTPMATFVTGALGGVDPSIMGVGPVASTKKALAKVNMTIDDMDLIEANEAFAAQSVAVARDLKFDMSKVNVNGGAIALGHPVGASGCRILVTLLHEMQKRDAKKGLATLCIGGGMGCTTIVERD